MSLHLEGRVGPFGLLLASAMVLEVWPVGAGGDSGAVQLWRGRALPLIDTRMLFGLPARPAGAPVVEIAYGKRSDDPGAVVLKLDLVAGVTDLGPDDLKPMPAISPLASLAFDGVTLHRNGTGHLLRLRPDADFDALRQAVAATAEPAAAVKKGRTRRAAAVKGAGETPAAPKRGGRSGRSRARAAPPDPG